MAATLKHPWLLLTPTDGVVAVFYGTKCSTTRFFFVVAYKFFELFPNDSKGVLSENDRKVLIQALEEFPDLVLSKTVSYGMTGASLVPEKFIPKAVYAFLPSYVPDAGVPDAGKSTGCVTVSALTK